MVNINLFSLKPANAVNLQFLWFLEIMFETEIFLKLIQSFRFYLYIIPSSMVYYDYRNNGIEVIVSIYLRF